MNIPDLKRVSEEILRDIDQLPQSDWNEYLGTHLNTKILSVVEYHIKQNNLNQVLKSAENDEFVRHNFAAICAQSCSSSSFLDDLRQREIFSLVASMGSGISVETIFRLAIATCDTSENVPIFSNAMPTVSGRLFHTCADLTWSLFARESSVTPRNRESALELGRILDAIYEYQYLMIAIGGYNSNFIPLCGIRNWFESLTDIADQFFTPNDFKELSSKLSSPTLIALHSSRVDFDWLVSQIKQGSSEFVNNPHIPRELVDKLIEEMSYNQQSLLFHPNADPNKALAKAIQLLEADDELNGLQPWWNMRDDGLLNFNFFREGEVAQYVIDGIMRWCEQDMENREHIAELFAE